jgi:hypothetical protein
MVLQGTIKKSPSPGHPGEGLPLFNGYAAYRSAGSCLLAHIPGEIHDPLFFLHPDRPDPLCGA